MRKRESLLRRKEEWPYVAPATVYVSVQRPTHTTESRRGEKDIHKSLSLCAPKNPSNKHFSKRHMVVGPGPVNFLTAYDMRWGESLKALWFLILSVVNSHLFFIYYFIF